MAWDVLSGVTKTAWDVLSWVANLCGMFCPVWQKMAWDVLSRDVLSSSNLFNVELKLILVPPILILVQYKINSSPLYNMVRHKRLILSPTIIIVLSWSEINFSLT